MTTVMWLRRDLRLSDHPALAVAAQGGPVVPLFVRDPRLSGAGHVRLCRLEASLAALSRQTEGALVVRTGDPAEIVASVAAESGADSVHVTADFTPYGRSRDAAVADRLVHQGVPLVASGSPYAVPPGTVRTGSGRPFRVFTPFARSWREAAREAPTDRPTTLEWHQGVTGEELDRGLLEQARAFGPAGEVAAHQTWLTFLDEALDDYAAQRDRPDLDGTSRLSAHLKFGEIHPRTLLADLRRDGRDLGEGGRSFVNELAWREFYADVLWHRPDSAWADLRDLSAMRYDSGSEVDALVRAWACGRTGYPFVDAGMRQLRQTGWMHNRVRMVTASFLVKDLHVRWPIGARHFLDHLIDGDLASNNHNWQWVAGTGTDASPYFRVFNPVTQGKRFDPDGGYVRRWVPELAHLPGATAHEPWRREDGYATGYPERIVAHDDERRDALERYQEAVRQ